MKLAFYKTGIVSGNFYTFVMLEQADRFEKPMPLLIHVVSLLEEKVNAHIVKMGFIL